MRFEWRNLIELSSEWGQAERKAVEAELDKLEPLNIMQETLRDIPLNKLYDWQPDKIMIAPVKLGFWNNKPSPVGYDIKKRCLVLPSDLKINFGYKDIDNKTHEFSLARILLHELQHTIDPQVKFLERETIKLIAEEAGISKESEFERYLDVEKNNSFFKALGKQSKKFRNHKAEMIMKKDLMEQITVARVNPTMKYYFDEPERAFYFITKKECKKMYSLAAAVTNAKYDKNPSEYLEIVDNQPLSDINQDFDLNHIKAKLKKRNMSEQDVEHTASWVSSIKKQHDKDQINNFPRGSSRYY